MNKLLLLLLVMGIIYVLYTTKNCEQMSNIKTINVSATKLGDNDKIQYIEFVTNAKQPSSYVMINYKELSENKKKLILQAIKDNGINSLQGYLCPPDTEFNIDNCVNYANKIKTMPIFLVNNKDYKDNNILSVKSVYNKKKDGTLYNSLIPYNTPKVDFVNKKVLDFSITKVTEKDMDNASLYFDKNNNLVLNNNSLKQINHGELNDLILNELKLKDKTILYYMNKK